jgi:hypothetical protein
MERFRKDSGMVATVLTAGKGREMGICRELVCLLLEITAYLSQPLFWHSSF